MRGTQDVGVDVVTFVLELLSYFEAPELSSSLTTYTNHAPHATPPCLRGTFASRLSRSHVTVEEV